MNESKARVDSPQWAKWRASGAAGGIKPVEAPQPKGFELQGKAAGVLVESGFIGVVAEVVPVLEHYTLENATWDENGNSTVKGIKGKPNSAGVVVSWGVKKYPEIRRGELLGTTVAFRAAVVEAHADGTIDVKGEGTSRKDWTVKGNKAKAVTHAMEVPGYFRYVEPLPEALKDELIPYEPMAGSYINDAAVEMANMALETGKVVVASFNDIGLTVRPGTNPHDIVAAFNGEMHKQHEEYANSPQGKYNQRESERRNREMAIEAAKPIATFAVKDEEAWKKWVEHNRDPYGNGVIRYAARWANLMEKALAEGASLEDVAEKLSQKADTEGITGFMYGAAVSALATSWEHGEELRRWHNLESQIGNEGEKANETGGVLNPAIINLGPKEA
jgi:hypothetical protein